MKTKYYMSIGLFSIAIILSGCSSKTYSHQMGHNTFTSSSDSRNSVFEEAIETCEDIDLKIKVLEEKAIDKETYILKYKCLDIQSLEYKER